jgi:hypothetical protein
MDLIKYLEKKSERRKQRAELLIINPEFQRDIKSIRARWDIPAKGFTHDAQLKDWSINLENETDKYYREGLTNHRKDVLTLREKDYLAAEKLQKEINNKAPLNAFRLEKVGILKKYKLSPRWKEWVGDYILTNKSLGVPVGILMEKTKDPETGFEQIKLVIDEDTTQIDLDNIIYAIKIHQKTLPYYKKEKFHEIKNLKVGKLALELKNKKISGAQIANKINNELCTGLAYSDIPKLIKRHKKHIGID